ncbi:hypothetical protein LIPSTDRAFT_229592 [Lipomyces starkeyi NRRL Y-11557]|uniref:Uncharacterized protein n=1 Tax=Lipomyces starkeyi NRRL Y-11557 TaxID=675824 RepID=A0A1E3QB07_LIPST|nr:hypothetical protein LIPSTDRAFT_229592 [Lipomyces starkeyi NRRL Y-11557]
MLVPAFHDMFLQLDLYTSTHTTALYLLSGPELTDIARRFFWDVIVIGHRRCSIDSREMIVRFRYCQAELVPPDIVFVFLPLGRVDKRAQIWPRRTDQAISGSCSSSFMRCSWTYLTSLCSSPSLLYLLPHLTPVTHPSLSRRCGLPLTAPATNQIMGDFNSSDVEFEPAQKKKKMSGRQPGRDSIAHRG